MDKLNLRMQDHARKARVCRKCKEFFLAHTTGERVCPVCAAQAVKATPIARARRESRAVPVS